MQAGEEGRTRNVLIDVQRPDVVADGLPEDPVQAGEDIEEPHDEEAKAEPGESKDTEMKGGSQEGAKNDEDKANGGKAKEEPPPFEMLDSMKGRLLRFTLEEGELETIPTGRQLKDGFPEDSGVVYVDQVSFFL